MPFLPFGDRFDIASSLPPKSVKAAIRAKKMRWFEGKNGARGWIVGPYICLWWSMWNRNGPMLIGRIREDGMGTRVSGRAGSDLNGVIASILLGAVFVPFILMGTLANMLFFGIILAAALTLTLWMASLSRREAAPLVHFLEKTVIIKVRPPNKRT